MSNVNETTELVGTLDLPAPPPVEEAPVFKRRCYDVRYRLRWFPSKGAHLVLVWTLLVSIAFGSLDNLFTGFLDVFDKSNNALSYLAFLPYIPWFVFALLSGWIADCRAGNHTMVRAGVLIYFIAAILACILSLVVGEGIHEFIPSVIGTLIHFVGFAGRAMILVTSLQLGLDQMPDAFSPNVTSFIAWFVACLYAGNWVNAYLHKLLLDCWLHTGASEQIFSVISVAALSVVLCTDFLLSKSWFLREGKCMQSFKTILKIVDFAAKHKAPLNRSALTYWEEDIPSRLDLGKSRYGGPFSTEQVEDVKTILRIIALSVSFGFVFTSFYLFQQFVYVKDFNDTILATHNCTTVLLRAFTYSTSFWVVGGIAIYEFAIYPFAVPIIPTILKRIGFTSLLTIIVNGISLVFSIVDFVHKNDSNDSDWFWILQSLVSALLKIILLTSAIEFVCAQSPHRMKGLMIGYMWSNYYISNILANILAGLLHTLCTGSYCSIIYTTVATGLSLLGLVLFCILARWYKGRVRDDIATPHRWVADVYDKYLPGAKT